MTLRLGVSLVVLCAPLLLAAPAWADLPSDCSGLGQALAEHSCFHVEFGPTTTVVATPGSETLATTPAIDSVHTEYRVALPNAGGPNVVTYQPQRTGAWTIFLDVPAPLAVVGPDGPLEPRLVVDGNTGCDALTTARVFDLVEGERYTVALGPSSTSEVIVVIEYVDDFITSNGRDVDQDGYGDPLDVVETPCLPPAGYAPNALDCDDGDPLVHPSVVETCDGVDENCNTVVDDVGLPCRVGQGACQATGLWSCPAPGQLAACDAVAIEGSAEACNNFDDDCDGEVDEEVTCPADQPACVRSGSLARCGCALDSDCGTEQSGKVCDVAAQRCVDGCSNGPAGNGCPGGAPCVVDEATGRGTCGTTTSTGVMEGAGGASSGTASAGVGGEGGAGGDDLANGGTNDGCGCAVAGQRGATEGGMLSAVIGAGLGLAWLRRRRSRGVVVLVGCCVAGNVFGCGASVVSPEETTSGGDGGSSTTGGDGDGDGEGGAAACSNVLARDPIDHACSHGVNGIPVDVVATPTQEGAPDVSGVHVPYYVAFQAGQAGWLQLTPRRDGEHVAFTGAEVPLRVVSAAGDEVVVEDTAWDDSCPAFAAARATRVTEGATYFVQVGPIDAPVLLYFEHLGTFGEDAWADRCDAGG